MYIKFNFIFQLFMKKLYFVILFFYEKLDFLFFNEIFRNNFIKSNLFTDTHKTSYCSEIFLFGTILFTKSNLLLIPIKHLTVPKFFCSEQFY